jgi:hypothetical protein
MDLSLFGNACLLAGSLGWLALCVATLFLDRRLARKSRKA